MPSRDDLNLLVEKLRDLAASSPTDNSDLPNWYAKARQCEAFISKSGLSDLVPHNVWHYLADADIRAKESGYRRFQQAEIAELIEQLASVDIPVDAA